MHALAPALVKRRACPGFADRLQELARLGDFDVVHAHIHAAEVAAAAAVEDTAAALVLTEHTEAPWRSAEDRSAIVAACGRAEEVLAVSPAVARGLRDRFGAGGRVAHRAQQLAVPASARPPADQAGPHPVAAA